MTRAVRARDEAALNTGTAADKLDAWLQQRRATVGDGRTAAGLDLLPAEEVTAVLFTRAPASAKAVQTSAKAPDAETYDDDRAIRCEDGVPLHLPHTDWLHHRLFVTGSPDALIDFQATASGAGTIPWQFDGDRMTEDLFHLLMAPAAPQRRRLSLAGARELARQLREAAELRHAAACARVGHSRTCPFDLHALVPVPPDILRLGPDEPDALAWLWAHWGTTAALRHVAIEPIPVLRTPLPAGTATVQISFWSADWTPWRALAVVRARWPTLHVEVRPTYGLL